jgi:hypothetical protein
MQLAANLKSRKRPGLLACYAPAIVGTLILSFTPISGYDDGWLDPKWWLLFTGWALLGWASLRFFRRWRMGPGAA